MVGMAHTREEKKNDQGARLGPELGSGRVESLDSLKNVPTEELKQTICQADHCWGLSVRGRTAIVILGLST